MFKRFGVIAVLLMLFFASVSSAQLFDSIGGTLKDADIGGNLGGAPTTAAPTDTAFLSYQVDPAVTTQVLEEFINSLKQSGQVTAEQMTQVETAIRDNINREAMQQFIDQLFPGENLKLENMADIFTIYLVASFVVINDLQDGTSTEQDMAVRNQVISAFASTPEMQNLSDAEKQKFSEALLLYVMFLANDWQQALQGAEGYDLNTVKAYAKDSLVQMGIDPAQFDFTPQGLIRKGTAGQTPQTQTPTTQTPQGNTPATPGANLTPEELEALPQCQQIVANPDIAKEVENGEQALKICQELVAKAGGTAPQTPTTQTPNTQDNPLDGSAPENPLGGADPFVGSFSGNNLTLTLQGANGAYTGELNFNGQPFPVQATSNGTNLTGTFTSGSNTFNFTATLQDKALTLISDGSTFNLTKQ